LSGIEESGKRIVSPKKPTASLIGVKILGSNPIELALNCGIIEFLAGVRFKAIVALDITNHVRSFRLSLGLNN
jgi:hypothetical protein